MKLEQTTIQKTFTVQDNRKTYYVDYLNSNGQILGLLNRNNWEITDENGEELGIYEFQSSTKREKMQIKENRILARKLINVCIKHFNDYKQKF
ncbi:MAG: hypothetical protein AABY07_10685 [Nanoarchaeota archaeon]